MAGHSKWNNIKNRKEKSDSQRARIFTKIGRELTVAVKEGGPDPESNGKLRDIIAKAKANNVPNDNIERIIKKAAGGEDKNNYETILYEGYGPSGVAVIAEALTDNRNRTAGDLRHYFDKSGGNLGQSGCVSFLFEQKGVLIAENTGFSEENVLEHCMESGAEDVTYDEAAVEFICAPNDLRAVREALTEYGYRFISAAAEYLPTTEAAIDDPDLVLKMGKLLDSLEDSDDIQNVWHNWANEPEER